jgi:hypothetical protein
MPRTCNLFLCLFGVVAIVDCPLACLTRVQVCFLSSSPIAERSATPSAPRTAGAGPDRDLARDELAVDGSVHVLAHAVHPPHAVFVPRVPA